jgi:pimeloyl-ACP methyl ester carboxylesterase
MNTSVEVTLGARFHFYDILNRMSKKHTITLRGGTQVAYWEYHADRPTTIIMIHGFRGTHHGLEKIVESLPDYHVIVPDLPGFGVSQPLRGRPHGLDAYTAFLKDFIASVALTTPPVLLGHSFGSIITSHYAAHFPKTISKLILVNPIGAPALKGPRGVMTRLAIGYYWLGQTLPGRASHAWLSAKPIVKIMSVAMAKSKDKQVRAFIHDQHLQHFSTFANPHVVAEAFDASVSTDVSAVADKIVVPTLLIVGDQDDITPLTKQQLLHSKMPSATMHIITDVGHLIHYEKPGQAATAIRDFLQQ